MAYIGKSPSIGSYSMLDNLTASATASYSLTLDSVAFVPESANHLIVSLNGVIQKAGSSFTVSGSTLTFSSTLASSDSIDFVLALGNVLDIGTPSDATVTNAKTNFVSTSSAAGLQIKGDGTTDGTLQLNCSQNSHGIKLKSPAHSASASYTLTFPTTDGNADEFLKTDGSGVLSWGSAGGTNTPAWFVTKSAVQSISNNTYTTVTYDTEVVDSNGAFASNAFTVPSGQAGKYYVFCTVRIDTATDFDPVISIIAVNGTRTLASWHALRYYEHVSVEGIVNLSVGDAVTHIAKQDGGTHNIGHIDQGAVTRFGGFKLIGV